MDKKDYKYIILLVVVIILLILLASLKIQKDQAFSIATAKLFERRGIVV